MGQPPIEDHALLSDRQTAALVADGVVNWWCVPRFDSPAVFASLLGDSGNGRWEVRPVAGRAVNRGYRQGSFVLDVNWQCPDGTVTTTDFLIKGASDSDQGSTLVRQVTCTQGRAEVSVELMLRFDYGRVKPWVRQLRDRDGARILYAIAGPHSLTMHGPSLAAHGPVHRGRFPLAAGDTLVWSLAWRPSHTGPPVAVDAAAELARDLDDWAKWRSGVPVSGPYAEPVADSLAVLRALTLHTTGGIVAAPTTSLPEQIGGTRNWDYRYTWLRDSAFTIQALAGHGHHGVAMHWRDWLLRAIAGDPEDLQIMYGVGGERNLAESTLDHLAGYRGSKPVRVGNGAFTQYQADVLGEIMMALDQLRQGGVTEGDDFAWQLQIALLEVAERRLDVPDRGIWEVRGDPHLFTHGRVMMWAAFDRAVRAVADHGLAGPVDRWRRHRDRLRAEIRARGVRGGAFVQHYDTDAVDAALLQIPQTGFVSASSEVMTATVARIERELVDEHGFVRRYRTDGSDGIQDAEGAFLMCTFWLVEQYARSGRRTEAVALMERLLAIRTDLGLLAEEYDPGTGRMLGNFPQAFSHLALVRAAEALS